MSVFKASAAAMGEGGTALATAAREIDAARAELESAYGRLQGQWRSSEARARADREYEAVTAWLTSAAAWARSGNQITTDSDALFARVEHSGIA